MKIGVIELKTIQPTTSEVTVAKIGRIKPMKDIKRKIRRVSREKRKKQMNHTSNQFTKKKFEKESARSNDKNFKVDYSALEKIYMASTMNNFYSSRVSLKQINQD